MNPAVTDSKETAVSSGMKGQLRQERQRAIAGLLRRPLLQSMNTGDELLSLVRRHQIWLRDWFIRHCGWTLQVDSDFARLRKTPPNGADATRPLLDSHQQPFTRRRYVLLCLALAVLEKSERQTVLNKLADEIASRFQLDPQLRSPGFTFDVSIRDHRRDLIEVVRYLLGLNVLSKVDGDEQQYLSSGRDVLYNINTAALAVIPNFRRGPSTITASDIMGRLDGVLDEPYPNTDEGRNRRLRTHLFRRLLDDPLVYYADLDEQERVYLVSQRPSIVREIEAATSLVQEARREGLAMVDPDDEMIDIGMPEEGTDGHVTLLVGEYLASRLRAGAVAAMPISEIERHIESLIPLHKTYWRKSVTDAGAAQLLAADAVTRLEKLRLIACDTAENAITPLPAIGRFALGKVMVEAPKDAELWGN